MNVEFDPKCDKCDAPITTGMMAALCPLRGECEFWPKDATEDEMQFLNWVSGDGTP